MDYNFLLVFSCRDVISWKIFVQDPLEMLLEVQKYSKSKQTILQKISGGRTHGTYN